MFLKITITIVILICILAVWISHKPISYIADLPQTELRIESDNQIYPGTEYVPQHKLHIVGKGNFNVPPEQRPILWIHESPANPIEPILTVTASHNIFVAGIGCNIEGDYQFVIFAHKKYQTTMTPEEYETINAVIERAVSE